MSKAAELIEGLAGDGEFDSDGGFSLDREKARQKMRQFQLADPHRYVLLLVEVAAMLGAQQIRFEIDSDDMDMRFDGRALGWEDLDELYTSLFVKHGSPGIGARRQLALACNAVMALNPRFVKIESLGPEGGVRARLEPEQADEIERLAPGASVSELGPGTPWTTRVHVKERLRPGLFVRFFADLGGTIAEEVLLRERCAHASMTITLDGEPISHGLPRVLVAAVEFTGEGLRGVGGYAPEPDRSRRSAAVLLSNGVEVATHELIGSEPGLWFWIDAGNFRKDVSQNDIVRSDPSYEAMLLAIGGARDGVLAALAAAWLAGQFTESSAPTAAAVFELLRRCFVRWADPHWLHPQAGVLAGLADMPFWRTIDGRWLSPRAFVAEADPQRGLMFSRAEYGGVVPQGWGPIVFTQGQAEVQALPRIHPDARDMTEALSREVPREQARRRWLGRPHGPELPRGAWRHPIDFSHEGIRGQLALRPGKLSDIRLVVDEHLLCEVELDLGPLGLSAVLCGPFTVNDDFDGIVLDRHYAAGLLTLLAQLPLALTRWAEAEGELASELIFEGVSLLSQPDFPRRWLEAFGWGQTPAQHTLRSVGQPETMPALGLGGEGEEEHGQPTKIAELLRFATVDRRRASLATLDRDRRGRARLPGKILLVDALAPTTAASAELIVHVDQAQRQLLRAIFGATVLHDDTDAYLAELGRRNFLMRPQQRPNLVGVTWTVLVERPTLRGQVGVDAGALREWSPGQRRRAEVEVLVESRRLCKLDERAWLPGVRASIEWDDAPVDGAWEGLAGSLQPLRTAIDAALVELVRGRAQRQIQFGQRPDDSIRGLLWLALSAPFLSPALFSAWRRLRQAHQDHAHAVADYFELMTLHPGLPLEALVAGVELVLEAGVTPTAEAILEVTERKRGATNSAGRDFHRGVLEAYPTLAAAPMLQTAGGRPISLAALESAFVRSQEIAFVPADRALNYDGDDRLILVVDAIDRLALTRLFGAKPLVDASDWIHEQRSAQAFQARRPLDKLEVGTGTRMFGVTFAEDGFAGEIAIPPWMPGPGNEIVVDFCHQRRRVEQIRLHATLPMIAVVDDAEAELTADFAHVVTTSTRMAKLRGLLSRVIGERLLPALAEGYPALDEHRGRIAWAWIAAYWIRVCRGAGDNPNRLDEIGRRFATLPGFVDVDGTLRSLDDLIARYGEDRQLWTIERDPGHGVPPPMPVLRVDAAAAELLGKLFSRREDAGVRWRAYAIGRRRREQAEPLPALAAPPEVLRSVQISRHGLAGVLWLGKQQPVGGGVVFGDDSDDGKVIAVLDPMPLLPCRGVVKGATADDEFSRPALSGAARRYLEGRVIYLYSRLLDAHSRDLERADRKDFLDAAAVSARADRLDRLRTTAIALARAKLRNEGFDAILGSLERRLRETPLLRLNSGRLISVAVAAQVRPIELGHLGIWDPKAPPADDAERARLLLGKEPEPSLEIEIEIEAEAEVEVEVEAEPPLALEIDFGQDPARAGEAATEFDFDLSELSDHSSGAAAELAGASDVDIDALLVSLESLAAEPEPDRVGLLLARIRDELRMVRQRDSRLLSEGLLDEIDAVAGRGKQLLRIDDKVIFDSEHPQFVRATQDPDPIWVSFLASAAYTALNTWLESISNEDEQVFHAVHAQLLLSGLLQEA